MFKMAEEVKFFSFGLYYKRFFILNSHNKILYIQEGQVSKKVKSVPKSKMLFIDNVTNHTEVKQKI